MVAFIFRYWFSMASLFTLFYWDYSPLSEVINLWQTDFTAYITSLLLGDEVMQGYHIQITEHYSLVIEKACNGVIPLLFFFASIMAFPSTLRHKLNWAVAGYLTISFINIFRIWFVAKLVLQEKSNFSLAHDYLGNGLLILTGLSLFILFVKSRKS